jgi:hypothetical protein
MRVLAIAAASVLVVAIVAWFALQAASGLADTELSANGIAAMVLGIVLSLGLGAGLMALVFYSSRKGYDERAQPRADGGGEP